MDKLIYTAMSGAAHALNRQSGIANNLANAASPGFRAEIHRLRAVPVLSEGLPTRAFAVDANVSSDFTPGPIQETGRALDIAVQGKGWIALQMPDGSEAYTRNGNLELGPNGVLQTRSGLPVAGDGGSISVPPDSRVTIAADGTVSVLPTSGTRTAVAAIGRIKLVDPSPEQLERGADGLFRLSGSEVADVAAGVKVLGGHLEGSNVNAVEQMVAMIATARQFELQMKLLGSAEANDRAATQLLTQR